ncbi:MAG: glycosyltransferase family 4 protein [Waterburya sp.]
MSKSNLLKVVMLGPGLNVKGGISRNEKLFLDYAPPEVQISHISTKEDGTVFLKIRVFLQALAKLFWVLLIEEIDLVHIRGSHRGSAFRQAILTWLVKMFRKPIVLQTHASEFHIFYANLAPWLQKFLAWSFDQCDRFVVLSKSWKKFHTANLGLKPEQVTVMYNPVQVPSEVPIRNTSVPIKLIFLGYIGQRKGAFDLITAFASLPEEVKTDSLLIMAGDGEVEAAKDLVASLNLTDKIIFPGWIDTEKRDLLLAQADIFVLPSYNEGLPLSMLEAMAWELPAIVTPVGGIAEIVTDGENGLLVEPGNIEQLKDAIESLIVNEDLRLALGAKGRKSMMPLDIKNYWISFLNVYYSALKQRNKNIKFKRI